VEQLEIYVLASETKLERVCVPLGGYRLGIRRSIGLGAWSSQTGDSFLCRKNEIDQIRGPHIVAHDVNVVQNYDSFRTSTPGSQPFPDSREAQLVILGTSIFEEVKTLREPQFPVRRVPSVLAEIGTEVTMHLHLQARVTRLQYSTVIVQICEK